MARWMTLVLLLAGLGGAGTVAHAQSTGVTVRGIAYDSVRGAPLPGAFVTLGDARGTTADARGRFEFTGVAAGVHLFGMQHALLDSMGLAGVSVRATVTDGEARITLAVPSFATLWRAACGSRPVPRDSGFVYGTVLEGREGRARRALADAVVELSWIDVNLRGGQAFARILFRSETRTDANGEYGICGVPIDYGLRIQAAVDSAASGQIDLGPTPLRVLRRDLAVGPRDSVGSPARGTITGTVTDEAGRPIDGARVVLDDAPQVRSGTDGRFAVRDVLPGTRQLEVLVIGMHPVVVVADVLANELTTVTAILTRVTLLEAVRITGSPWQQRLMRDFDDRKRQGGGTVLDSTDIARRGTMAAVFSALPSVQVKYGRGGQFSLELPGRMSSRCAAGVWVDGFRAELDEIYSLRPEDIAAVESYPRSMQVPMKFMSTQSDCGVVVIWTKRFLR